MNYRFLCLLLLLLVVPATADHWYNEMIDDYKKVGDIASISDDADMQMTFVLNYPMWRVEEAITRALAAGRTALTRTNPVPSRVAFVSEWRVKESSAMGSFLTDIIRMRTNLTFTLNEINPIQTSLTMNVKLEALHRNSQDWRTMSDREARQAIRKDLMYVATYCRYSGSPGAFRQQLVKDYEDGRRHGEDGFELPKANLAPKPVVVKDTKSCPFCAEEIKAAAIKCRYCKEFLNGKNDSEQSAPTPSPGEAEAAPEPHTPIDKATRSLNQSRPPHAGPGLQHCQVLGAALLGCLRSFEHADGR